METTATDILTDVLIRAAKAHGVHEETELGGEYDEQWPRWYAEHMARTLAEDGRRLVGGASTDMKLEVLVVPVFDVGRAKDFYKHVGFREDIDYVDDTDFRVVQFTPPGSECSIIIGNGVTAAPPGSAQGLQLVVVDIEAARAELVNNGIDVSEVFHDAGGVFYHAHGERRVSGPSPQRPSYGSFASFTDPDGNGWILQEVTTRAPGR